MTTIKNRRKIPGTKTVGMRARLALALLTIRQWWRFKVSTLPHYFAFTPILLSVVSFVVLAFVGQLQEIYMRLLEQQDYPRFIAGSALALLLGCLLFAAYLRLTRHRTMTIQGSGRDIYLRPARGLHQRDIFAALIGVLPVFGLLLGTLLMHWTLIDRSSTYLSATRELARPPAQVSQPEVLPTLKAIDDAVSGVHTALPGIIGIAALAVLVILYLFRFRRTHAFHYAAWASAYAIAVVTLVWFPLLSPAALIGWSRWLGPLALALMQLITISAVVLGLIFLSRATGFRIIFILTLIIAASATITQFLTSSPAPEKADANAETPKVVLAFFDWLNQRKVGSARYPVYIVAAQGGGIYAASAAATFLGHLHDRERRFHEHLFSVSAVSGGAVGSALYSDFASKRRANPECTSVTPSVRAIVAQDHLSPVLALVAAEYGEKALLGLSARNIHRLISMMLWRTPSKYVTRASALQESLILEASKAGHCGGNPRDTALSVPYSDGAQPGQPAFIFNTTHAETGERVAFAPFKLRDVGQGSLSSFSDDGFVSLVKENSVDLATAAVASARFPGLMPALSFPTSKGQINFVDGGYADNSGVATAGAIFDALSKALEQLRLDARSQRTTLHPVALAELRAAAGNIDVDKIDLRMIVITDSERPRRKITEMSGTKLVDIIAPVLAILNVRSQISSREVFLAQDRHNAGLAEPDNKVRLVRLDGNFTLELGWTFSRSTNDVISLMVARPEFCEATKPTVKYNEDEAKRVKEREQAALLMWENACVVSRMLNEMKASRP